VQIGLAELKASDDFIVESTREYLPNQKKTVPGYKVVWKNCPEKEYSSTTINQSEICFDIPAASMKDVKMLEALSCKSNEIVNTDYLKNKI
jgi:hypothetical protein